MAAAVAGAQAPPARAYGARGMTQKTYWLAQVALGCGSILEWFDFSAIAVLEPVITKLFFPASMGKSQLPFWIIFSVTFVSRPFGGLLFAAIADLYGRKPCLLASVITMGVTSVLIGCLPTYPMIGVAAPVLLALLRLVQGLALGGEYTAAVVTAYELSPPEGKNMGGAVAFAAGSFGSFMGVAVPMIVFASVSQEALFLWGWRVPFLASVVTAGVALLLRTLMVEPDEFVEQRERDLAMAAAAAQQAAEEEEEGEDATLEGGKAVGGKEVELLPPQNGAAAAAAATAAAAAAADGRQASCSSETAPLAAVALRAGAAPSSSGGATAAAAAALRDEAAEEAGGATTTTTTLRHRRRWGVGGGANGGPANSSRSNPTTRRAHRALPVSAVFRYHWHKVLLQCLYTAASTASVFTYSAWLPLVFLTPPVLLPRMAAYGTILLTVVVAMPSGLLAARACDKGLIRPVTLSIIAIAVGAGVICAYFFAAVPRLATPTTHVALIAATLTGVIPHNCVYGSLANVMGRIYPPTLRVTGFSTGHNLASSIFGGFAPIIMQGLQGRWQWGGPAVYLSALCALSIAAALLMVRLYPGMNALPSEAAAIRAREREAAEAEVAEAGRRVRALEAEEGKVGVAGAAKEAAAAAAAAAR